MEKIFKTPQKATYFKGMFQLRNNESTNWASPIDFPTVFTAYGAAIKYGNWRRCTSINTPKYVINNYFDGKADNLKDFWDAVFLLENINWADVDADKNHVLDLINRANNELLKLKQL